MECYSYKIQTNKNNVHNTYWNEVVQCCYVLIMENSSREKQIAEQIKKLPSNLIIFQYNKKSIELI